MLFETSSPSLQNVTSEQENNKNFKKKMYIIIYTICVLRYYAIRLIETKMPINDIIILRNIHMHI